jgi:cytochrome c oxidase cbb3-type subunit 3
MMRFIRPFLETLPGVNVWGLISLLIFFGFFVTLLWWVRRMRPAHVDAMKNMPLALLLLLGFPGMTLASTGSHWGMSDDNWIVALLTSAGVLTAMVLVLLSVIKHLSALKRNPNRGQTNQADGAGTLNSLGMGVLLGAYALSDSAFYGLITANLFLMMYVGVLLNMLTSIVDSMKPREEVAPAAAPAEVGPTWWERVWQKLNAHVELSKEQDILLNHAYDGIKELDNRLPPWWLQGFYLSIVVAVLYLFNFHILKYQPLSGEAYEEAMAAHRDQVQAYLESLALNVDETSVRYLIAEDRIKHGRSLFNKHCVACHAPDGGGALGPNFTDEYWLHGGTIQDVFKVIKYGVPKNGMRSWQKDLSPVEIQDVATFVMSLQGTNPAQPKEPQGDPYPPAVPDQP